MDSTIAITQLGEALVRAVGDTMDLTNGRKKGTDHHIRDLGRTVAKVDNPQLGSSWREAEWNIPIADPGGQDSLALCTRLECKVQAPLRKNCAVVSRSLFMACNKSGNTTEEPTK